MSGAEKGTETPTDEWFSISPQHCTTEGGVKLTVSMSTSLPEPTMLHLLFTSSQGTQQAELIRDGALSFHATVPAHSCPEQVKLSLCSTDSNGKQTIHYTLPFTYTEHDVNHLAKVLLHGSKGGVPLQSSIIPLLESTDDIQEFDRSLAGAMAELEIPAGWSLAASTGEESGNTAPDHQETLLHLVSRHNLTSLAQHLMTLPGASLAVYLPNEQGLTPVDVARDIGNMEVLKILTSFVPSHAPSVNGDISASEGVGSSLSSKKNSLDELQKFREINQEWKGQIRRHKASSSFMGTTNYSGSEYTTTSRRDRLLTPPFPDTTHPSHLLVIPCQRRRSIAVMESSHHMQINVKDPVLAEMERQRKMSWSVVVGDTDSRSVDTGLNELDRVIAEDLVQERVSQMQENLEASRGGSSHLNPNHLNLFYSYSLSCPLLVENDESATHSLIPSTRTSPGPVSSFSEDDGRASADAMTSSSPQHLLPMSVSVPEALSESSLSRTDTCSSTGSLPPPNNSTNPLPIPEVITTCSTDDMRPAPQSNGSRRHKRDPAGKDVSEQTLETQSGSTISVEEDDGFCQSLSTPNLLGFVDQEGDTEEQSSAELEGEEGGEEATDGATSTEQNQPRKDDSLRVVSTTAPDTQGSTEGRDVGDLSPSPYLRAISTPVDRLRKRSHRRSLSMSEMETCGPNSKGKLEQCEEEATDGDLLPNGRSATLQPRRKGASVAENNQSLDQQSSASASRSNSIKGGDNRSRASSFFTETSSVHESAESSEEDNAAPEHSGISFNRMETQEADPMTTPTLAEKEHHLKLPPDVTDGVVVRRSKKPHQVPQDYRYSADFVNTHIANELESSSVLSAAARRLNSESTDERCEVSLATQTPSQTISSADVMKDRLGNDSVFEQELTLSDIDVKVPSDDNLSQSFEGSQDNTSPLLSQSSAVRYSKRKVRSPLLGRKSQTVKDKSSAPRLDKQTRGLSKQEVSPLIGKMRTIFNEGSEEEEEGSTSPSLGHRRKPAPSEERPAATSRMPKSPDECTSLDRVPRSPVTSQKPPLPNSDLPSRHPVSPLSYQHQVKVSPPPSPPTTSDALQISHERRSTSPSFLTTGEGTSFHKSSSDKTLHKHKPPRPVKSLSMDVGSSASALNFRRFTVETLQEENGEEEDEEGDRSAQPEDLAKKKGNKFIREGLFRRSKSKKKAMTILGGGPDVEKAINDSFAKGAGGTGAIRAKNQKQRPKLSNNLFQDPSKFTAAGGEDGTEEMGDKETSPPAETEESKPHLRRQGSENMLLLSPTKNSFDQSLSGLAELPQISPTPTPNDPLSPAPATTEAAGSDSDHEEMRAQLVRSMSESHPELEIKEEQAWDRTVDRRLYRKLNKHERERQAIIHELLQTERHHFRALHVLKFIFKGNFSKYVLEDTLEVMFPELDSLIEISSGFLKRLEERRGGESTNAVVHDISDILVQQFSGTNREKMLAAFGGFCSCHLVASEVYKEQLKKKPFNRLIQELYRLKECQRLYLPDYYTGVTQRLAKMVQLLQRLVKKTDALKLDHAEQLRRSERDLETLVAAVDQAVEDRKNQLELKAIQERMEVNLPRSAKNFPLREMKALDLMAQERRLVKRGDAVLIHGHGKQIPVHIVLVTDLLVLLTERDQKYHIAALQDLKPPIIRLYDLHVRVNASVRSGVQLLLLEKGSFPEMFRLEFHNKKETKAWELTLNKTVDVCREKELKCEYFGSEPVVAVEEERKEEIESSMETGGVNRSESQRSTVTIASENPSIRRIRRARETLEVTSRVLSMFVSSSYSTMDVSPRHFQAGTYRIISQSPKNRAHTVYPNRPKTADSSGGGGGGEGERAGVNAEIDGTSKKAQKSKTKRKGLDRSSTFKGRGEDKREREKDRGGGGGGGGGGGSDATDFNGQLIDCTYRLKGSLEEMLRDIDEKDKEIERLKKELEKARKLGEVSVMARNPSPQNSPPQFRPHSIHVDSSSLSQPADMDRINPDLAQEFLTADAGT